MVTTIEKPKVEDKLSIIIQKPVNVTSCDKCNMSNYELQFMCYNCGYVRDYC